MGYLITLPVILLALVLITGVWGARRRDRRKLDYRKGTSFEKPQDEGATRGEEPASPAERK